MRALTVKVLYVLGFIASAGVILGSFGYGIFNADGFAYNFGLLVAAEHSGMRFLDKIAIQGFQNEWLENHLGKR